MKKLLLGLALLASPAYAADLPIPRKAVAVAPATLCSVTSCTGFYAGVDVTGMGSNLDILGSGINGSVFAGGMMIGAHAGYQLWNGAYFIAGEAGCSYDVSQRLSALGGGPSDKYICQEVLKAGMQLAGLFGIGQGAPAAPSQGPVPINIPALLQNSLMSPFVTMGAAQRHNKNGLVTGAGANFVLSSNWSTTFEYRHINYQKGEVAPGMVLDTENLVRVSFDYHFN